MSFPGSSVLVTGGSRGIGKAIALRFAALGASRVAIGYFRSDAAAEETAEELRSLGAEPILVRGNISSTRVLEEVAELGPIDVLVHNAATGVIRPALETEDKHWDWTMTANTRALLSLARVAAPTMRPGSSIVGISSLGAQHLLPVREVLERARLDDAPGDGVDADPARGELDREVAHERLERGLRRSDERVVLEHTL